MDLNSDFVAYDEDPNGNMALKFVCEAEQKFAGTLWLIELGVLNSVSTERNQIVTWFTSLRTLLYMLILSYYLDAKTKLSLVYFAQLW